VDPMYCRYILGMDKSGVGTNIEEFVVQSKVEGKLSKEAKPF